jgi:hypothetical protein
MVLAVGSFLMYSLAMSNTSTARPVQVQSYAEVDDIEHELTFEFEYTPAEKGSRDFYGQQNEPDTHGRMEFYCATDQDGMEVEVIERHIEAARELAWQEVAND